MPRIPLEKLEVGMKLTRPVRTEHGVLLLDQGTEISDTILRRLETSCIKWVYVASNGGDGTRMEMLARLDARFSKTVMEPHMGAIKAALRDHLDALYG